MTRNVRADIPFTDEELVAAYALWMPRESAEAHIAAFNRELAEAVGALADGDDESVSARPADELFALMSLVSEELRERVEFLLWGKAEARLAQLDAYDDLPDDLREQVRETIETYDKVKQDHRRLRAIIEDRIRSGRVPFGDGA